jgi:hypothetical protein
MNRGLSVLDSYRELIGREATAAVRGSHCLSFRFIGLLVVQLA